VKGCSPETDPFAVEISGEKTSAIMKKQLTWFMFNVDETKKLKTKELPNETIAQEKKDSKCI
jgi:hypothetical protein